MKTSLANLNLEEWCVCMCANVFMGVVHVHMCALVCGSQRLISGVVSKMPSLIIWHRIISMAWPGSCWVGKAGWPVVSRTPLSLPPQLSHAWLFAWVLGVCTEVLTFVRQGLWQSLNPLLTRELIFMMHFSHVYIISIYVYTNLLNA